MKYKFVFGPVASSRLGLSLGLDLLGRKICSFDCLYCEVGPTKLLTVKRAPYVPAEEIISELERWKEENQIRPDHITLGGSGEPCLNSDMGRILIEAKRLFPDIPRAILTNSSMFFDPSVRAEAALADVVLPSMDALVPHEFTRLNRPHSSLDPAEIAENLLRFRSVFQGKIYLEVLLSKGINDSKENLELLTAFRRTLRPERVDVVTMTRPGAYAKAAPVANETLALWRDRLEASVSTTAPQSNRAARGGIPREDIRAAVLASLSRRPQTPAQLALALAVDLPEIELALANLREQGHITSLETSNGPDFTFYKAARPNND